MTALGGPARAAAAPVAVWHMDETSGSTMHDAVAGHDGALDRVELGQPGFSGTAFGFTGASSVSVPSADDLNPHGDDITITTHLKTTQAPADPDWDIVRKGVFSDPGEYKMEFQPSGQLSCGFAGSAGSSELMAGPALDDGAWHTVQCVKTASAIAVVVDGQTFSQDANIGSIANDVDLVIGAHPGSEFFEGTLDETSVDVGAPAPQPAPAPAPPPSSGGGSRPAPSPQPQRPPASSPPAADAPPEPTRAVETPVAGVTATSLKVSSTTLGRRRLILRGRLSTGASTNRLRITLVARGHRSVRITLRAHRDGAGRWHAVVKLPRSIRGLRRYAVTVRYLGQTGYAPATVRLSVRRGVNRPASPR